MAAVAHNVIKLLLFLIIRKGEWKATQSYLSFKMLSWTFRKSDPLYLVSLGVKEADGLSFPRYNVAYPCDDLVCYYIWHFSTTETSYYTAIVSNVEIQTVRSEDEDSKCTLHIDLTTEAAGHYHCQSSPDVSPYNSEYCQDLSCIAVWI